MAKMNTALEGKGLSDHLATGAIQPVRPPLRERLSRIRWLAVVFFFFFPKRFRGLGRRRGERLMRDVVDFLDAKKVPLQIDYGTLLGCIRDDGLIPWDEDIDLAVRVEDLPTLLGAAESAPRDQLRLETYVLPAGDFGDSGFSAGDVWLVRLVRPATLSFPREFYADIEIRRRESTRVWWAMLYHGGVYLCSASEEMLRDGPPREFLGRRVTGLPNQPEDYLVHVYGDWKEPNSDYLLPQDGSIVRNWPIGPAG